MPGRVDDSGEIAGVVSNVPIRDDKTDLTELKNGSGGRELGRDNEVIVGTTTDVGSSREAKELSDGRVRALERSTDGSDVGKPTDESAVESCADGRAVGSSVAIRLVERGMDVSDVARLIDTRVERSSENKLSGALMAVRELGACTEGSELDSASDASGLVRTVSGSAVDSSIEESKFGMATDTSVLGSVIEGTEVGSCTDTSELGVTMETTEVGTSTEVSELGIAMEVNKVGIASDESEV